MTETVDPARCPLCGKPNDCALVAGSAEPCWCTRVRVDEAVLERIPSPLRGVACVCRACVEKGAGDRGKR